MAPAWPRRCSHTCGQILDEYLGKLPILGVGLGFLAISAYLDLSLVDLPRYQNGSNFPVIGQKQRTESGRRP
jgi:anthranilate/para-aminobenzoate synthase component II